PWKSRESPSVRPPPAQLLGLEANPSPPLFVHTATRIVARAILSSSCSQRSSVWVGTGGFVGLLAALIHPPRDSSTKHACRPGATLVARRQYRRTQENVRNIVEFPVVDRGRSSG